LTITTNDIIFVSKYHFMSYNKNIDEYSSYANEPAVAYISKPQYTSSADLMVVRNARSGLKTGYFYFLGEKMDLSISDLAKILNVSLRTLQRYLPDHLLDTDASAKVIQLSLLNQHGLEVFGTQESFNSWLKAPVMDLDYQTPLSLLDTPFGFELVHHILGRIEHGVFA
jgi:putative toxin-antitoxin system antitoxin component (TIGR02293 family)